MHSTSPRCSLSSPFSPAVSSSVPLSFRPAHSLHCLTWQLHLQLQAPHTDSPAGGISTREGRLQQSSQQEVAPHPVWHRAICIGGTRDNPAPCPSSANILHSVHTRGKYSRSLPTSHSSVTHSHLHKLCRKSTLCLITSYT